MIQRTIQYQNGSYFNVMPKALIDSLNMKVGEKVSFGIANDKIIIASVADSLKSGRDATSPYTRYQKVGLQLSHYITIEESN